MQTKLLDYIVHMSVHVLRTFRSVLHICIESEILQTRAQLSHPFTLGKQLYDVSVLMQLLVRRHKLPPTAQQKNFLPRSFGAVLQRQIAQCAHSAEINSPSLCTIRSVKEN